MSECDPELLEDLVLGGLSRARAAETNEHVATCAACRDELALLRMEREVFAARAVALAAVPVTTVAAAVPTVATIVPRSVRRTRFQWALGGMGIAAAAAALLLAVHRPQTVLPDAPAPEAIAVDPAASGEICDDGFEHPPKVTLACEEPKADPPPGSALECTPPRHSK
jgi:anti-sigma factor RsiW